MERLQKVLAQAGIASRRKAEEMISAGKVKVNGKVVVELGTKVDVEKDKIIVDGKLIVGAENKVYFLLNKPAGYVTTMYDPQGRPTVRSLLKGIKERVYPVGRLDYDTEGLLLLTNDGELSYSLTHPKYGVEKVYQALVVGVPRPEKMGILRRGVIMEDGVAAPAKVKRLEIVEGNALLEIKIHEGKNRQVRRMCETIGHPVMKLKRSELGELTLQGLAIGTYRKLTTQEIDKLKKIGVQSTTASRASENRKVRAGKHGVERATSVQSNHKGSSKRSNSEGSARNDGFSSGPVKHGYERAIPVQTTQKVIIKRNNHKNGRG